MHPRDLYPKRLVDELRRVASLPFQWAAIAKGEGDKFFAKHFIDTLLCVPDQTPYDLCGMIANVAWIKDGPKSAKVTEQQYTALAKVDINLELHDIKLPYQTVMVVMPPGKLHKCCLVHRYSDDIMICVCISDDHHNDIVTIIRHWNGVHIESSLEKYDESCQDVTEVTTATLRVAINMLLALTNFGHRSDLLLPKEVAVDESIVKNKRGTEAAKRAAERIKAAPRLISFAHDVVLHRAAPKYEGDNVPTGRKTCFHWVRGHWKSQPYGEGRTLRKRIFVAPYMVNANELLGDKMDTTTTYRTRRENASNTEESRNDDASSRTTPTTAETSA